VRGKIINSNPSEKVIEDVFLKAIHSPENIEPDGRINFNFVDADIWIGLSEKGTPIVDEVSYYCLFNDLADKHGV